MSVALSIEGITNVACPWPDVLCPTCGTAVHISRSGRSVCSCGAEFAFEGNIAFLSSPGMLERIPEAATRNQEAPQYLQLPKFPTQLDSIRRFIDAVPAELQAFPALDLGCGPGPTTAMLLQRGYRVIAVDFSTASLQLNAASNAEHESRVMYVAADLKEFQVAGESCGVLMMADFLQHLGDMGDQQRFLHKILAALVPGGRFYLSCLNYNVKNWWKKDRIGSFSDGAMPGTISYRRSQVREVLSMLPSTIEVLAIHPMNIFHNAVADRMASRLPLPFLLARMIVVIGRRRLSEPPRVDTQR